MQTMYAPPNNGPQTTLADAIGSGEQSMTLADASGFPAAPNVLTIGDGRDAELVLYTSVTGNILAITRGFNGTTAKAWEAGTRVGRYITAQDMSAIQANINELNNTGNRTEANALADTDLFAISKSSAWYKIAWSTIKAAINTLISTFLPVEVSATITSLPKTIDSTVDAKAAYITSDMSMSEWELGNPSAFTSALTVTSENGSCTISGTMASNQTSTIRLMFSKKR